MLAYHAIEEQNIQEQDDNPAVLTHTLLEKVIKTYKSHRSVDSDCKWIKGVIDTMLKPIVIKE